MTTSVATLRAGYAASYLVCSMSTVDAIDAAGYCIDRPDLLPAGSTVKGAVDTMTTTVKADHGFHHWINPIESIHLDAIAADPGAAMDGGMA